jgi:hypothetical protein
LGTSLLLCPSATHQVLPEKRGSPSIEQSPLPRRVGILISQAARQDDTDRATQTCQAGGRESGRGRGFQQDIRATDVRKENEGSAMNEDAIGTQYIRVIRVDIDKCLII